MRVSTVRGVDMKRILSILLLLPAIVLADGYARHGQVRDVLPGNGILGIEYSGATTSITAFAAAIDADDEAGACIFQAPATGNLDAFHWRITTHNAAGDLDSRAESVDATDGDYSGTLLDTNTNCTITTSGTGVVTCDFTAEPAVTRGQIIAAVIERQTGTADVHVSLGVSTGTGHAFPYPETFVGGSMTKNGQRACNIAVEYSGSTPYYPITGVLPAVLLNSLSVASNTTPDEVGNLFNLPTPVNVCGVSVANNNVSTVDFDLKLYDTDQQTVLASFSVDGNIQGSSASLENGTYMFSSPVRLRQDVNYYATIVPTTTTNTTFYDFQVGTANMLNQLPLNGRAYKVSRVDNAGATSFTTDTSRLTLLDLVACGNLSAN